MPVIPLHCYVGHSGRRKYSLEECEFLVGYDVRSDIAYVLAYEEFSGRKSMVSVSPESEERWDKIRMRV